jgi:hypothetical protein
MTAESGTARRQSELDVAQARLGRGRRRGGEQSATRGRIAGLQCLQPALGFFLEGFESRASGELAAHDDLPSV